jgi:hypothetical protein
MPHLVRPRQLSVPAALASALAHATRFARSLRARDEHAAPEEPAALWLEGRAEEVALVADEVLADWAAGRVSTVDAREAIEGYLADLHAALEPWYGRWFAPSCCGPAIQARESGLHARPKAPSRPGSPTLVDTEPDGVPASRVVPRIRLGAAGA